jgi:hypothetical protein
MDVIALHHLAVVGIHMGDVKPLGGGARARLVHIGNSNQFHSIGEFRITGHVLPLRDSACSNKANAYLTQVRRSSLAACGDKRRLIPKLQGSIPYGGQKPSTDGSFRWSV